MPTGIPYANESWNPVVGCTPAGSGCYNCWAKRLHDMRHQAHKDGQKVPPQYALPFEKIQRISKRLDQPRNWRKPRTVFVCNMSDLFHQDVPFDFIDRVFSTIMDTERHTYLIFTKRLREARNYFVGVEEDQDKCGEPFPFPLPNVRFYFSVSKQAELRKAVFHLQMIPAAYKGLSIEPMLEPINLHELIPDRAKAETYKPAWYWLDGVIVGCEKAPKDRQRKCDTEWIWSLKEQIRAINVKPKCKLYVKQIQKEGTGKVLDDTRHFPKGLRIRDF